MKPNLVAAQVRSLNAGAPNGQEDTAGIIAVESSDAQIIAPWKK
jgi:hypothetical protein